MRGVASSVFFAVEAFAEAAAAIGGEKGNGAERSSGTGAGSGLLMRTDWAPPPSGLVGWRP